jgi:hypothetical protein
MDVPQPRAKNGMPRDAMTAPSVVAALSARDRRPSDSAVDSSLSCSTFCRDKPAFSAALSSPAFSTKLSSFFSSTLA